MKKRIVKAIIASLVLSMLTFAGCGKNDNKGNNEDAEETQEVEDEDTEDEEADDEDEVKVEVGNNKYGSWFPFGMLMAYDEEYKKFWQEPTNPIDAEDIYANTVITPEFMYGNFYYYDEKSCVKLYDAPYSFLEKSEWTDMADYIGYIKYESSYKDYEITTMPFAFEAGPESYFSEVNGIPGYYWCGLYFAVKKPDGDLRKTEKYEVPAAYEIVGDKIIFHLMTEYEYDYDNNAIDYKFGDKTLEYTFERGPISLTLSNGSQTVDMLSYDFLEPEGSDLTGVYLHAKLDDGEEGNLPFTECSLSVGKEYKTDQGCYLDLKDGYAQCVGRYTEDGVITICANEKDEITVYQYVLFDCGDDGAILCDENGTYYFLRMGGWAKENYGTMKVNNIRPEDMDDFGKLSEETINIINETREDLLDDLASALKDIGLGIKIDEETGDIILDAEVLFASNSAEVSEEGKAQLTEFALSLNEILQLEEYKDFISELHISGHTDSDGDYDYNKELSLKRAEAVKECILEALAEYPEDQAMIENILTVEGCSYDQLIYDEDGNEDKEASRRVVFSFFINVGNYVDQ